MAGKWHLTNVTISYLQNISLKCKYDAKYEPNNWSQKSFTECGVRTVQSLYFLSWTTVLRPSFSA